ncbi:MAG: beta-propeller fold lactonase family protein [Pseudomonadota bacterium]
MAGSLAVVSPTLAHAQEAASAPERVSARNAEGVRSALASAGYKPDLERDPENGEISIGIELENWIAAVLFRDCDATLPDYCDTLILSIGFDRNTPISDAAVTAANTNYRYVSVFRTASGDPYMQWALLTLDRGLDTRVFLEAVKRFEEVADAFSTVAFDDDSETPSTLSGTLFVANKRGNTLSKIDLASGEPVLELPSCTNPHELATSPDGRHVALACYGGTTVDIFSADKLEKVASIELGEKAAPHGIVWHRYGDIYVTAEGRQSIFHIAAPLSDAPVLEEFATGQEGSHMLAVAPEANTAWTTDLGSRTVTRVDLVTRREPLSVAVGEEPEGIALAPDGETLWVSARRSNQAFALDPETMEVRKTLGTGQFPLRLAIRPQGDVAVTSNLIDGSLTVIDLAKAEVVRTIAVSSPEQAEQRFQVTILWSDDGERVYVAETASNTVAEIEFSSGEVLRRLPTGEGGDGLAILP